MKMQLESYNLCIHWYTCHTDFAWEGRFNEKSQLCVSFRKKIINHRFPSAQTPWSALRNREIVYYYFQESLLHRTDVGIISMFSYKIQNQSHFKSMSLKSYITDWFVNCLLEEIEIIDILEFFRRKTDFQIN